MVITFLSKSKMVFSSDWKSCNPMIASNCAILLCLSTDDCSKSEIMKGRWLRWIFPSFTSFAKVYLLLDVPDPSILILFAEIGKWSLSTSSRERTLFEEPLSIRKRTDFPSILPLTITTFDRYSSNPTSSNRNEIFGMSVVSRVISPSFAWSS